ncbi:LysR family transcriptional regulator [Pantoea ananatis]|uniref:LysR family transcriptional regulator n=1 Tax=Pantoea ananas TaxID=553 RepID=UPI001B3074A1|nr:LysR family transcriptional regulator [Pantoea ananatis]
MKNKKNALIFDWIIYIKVVEKKSFSAAARELMMSVASVSKVIAKLEDIFSARLISRNAHKFEVTSSGQTAYEKALLICETYHNLLNSLECKDEIRGELRLSAPGIMCDNVINDWLIEYTDRHPRATVRLLSREAGSFSSDSPEFDDLVIKSGQLDSPDLIQRKLNPVPFGMYASPEYLRKNGEPIRPEDLSGHSLLRLSHYSLRNPVAFRTGETVIPISINSEEEFYSNSIQSLLHMTLHDRGICLAVPCWVIGHYEFDQRLCRVLPDWELTPLPAFIVWRYRKHYSALFSDFSSFIEDKWNCMFSDSRDFVE